MILGRPTNLWTGAFTSVFGLVVIIAAALGVDVGTIIVGAATTAFGAIIALVANQTPTIAANSEIKVQTPSGQPNATATVDVTRSGEVTVSQ